MLLTDEAEVRARLVLACVVAAVALARPGMADACSVVDAMPTPHELVERAKAIVHVKVRGMCSELTGPCLPPSVSASAKPYAPGWPPIAAPPAGFPPKTKGWEPGAGYELLAVEVVEVLKGAPGVSRFAIHGKLVTADDYNDRDPPYEFVRHGGRSGNCFAYTYKRDAEYLLFLRDTHNMLTPYWAPLAPVNEQVRSAHDPWIAWVRQQRGGK